MNRPDQRIRKEQLRRILPLLADEIRAPTRVRLFFENLVANDRMETEVDRRTLLAVKQFVEEPSRYYHYPQAKRIEFSDNSNKTPKDFYEINMLNDSEHWSYMHLTRNVVQIIIKNIERIALKKEEEDSGNRRFHDSVMKVSLSMTIQLCFWYLRHSDKPLEEAAKLSNLSISMVQIVILRGLKLLTYLKEDAKMCWPSQHEFMKTADAFLDKFNITFVVGVITHHIFTTVKGHRMLLQMLNDQHGMVKFANVTYDTRPRVAIATSPEFFRGLCGVPKDHRIVSDDMYNNVPRPLQESKVFLTPSDDSLSRISIFSESHKGVLDFGKTTLKSLIDRFPRLDCLVNCDPNAVLAACVIHNYCKDCNELPPPE